MAIDAIGVGAFLLASVLAAKNFVYTKGVTKYWLAITGAGLLGTLSAACVLDEIAGAVVFGPLHNFHLAYPVLAVTAFTVGGVCLSQNQLAKALICDESMFQTTNVVSPPFPRRGGMLKKAGRTPYNEKRK